MACSIPGCNRPIFARGWCSRHYMAHRKYGDPTKVLQKQHHGLTLEERLELYTKKTDGCWLWIGYRDPNGYGRLHLKGTPQLAHRLAYAVRYGSIPDDRQACHKCDNPQCVNPEHIFLGSQADNNHDKIRKGRARQGHALGEEHGIAKLTEAQVREIRSNGKSDPENGRLFGVSSATVFAIRHRKTWRHIK
jgi:hypothetical protein